jgi:peroxiredoxin
MSLLVFGVILLWLVVALGCWLGFQLLRQNGRMLLRLEALEQQLVQLGAAPGQSLPIAPSRPPSLPLGSAAPDFELPDLSGGRKKLSQFRGQRTLLIFFNPGCGFCVKMAPDLAALPLDGAEGRPVPLVVSTGDAEANRQLVKEHGIRCSVLLQEKMEVASAYKAGGTPMGYLIDEHGNIASEIGVGAQALLALANPAHNAAATGNGHRDYKGNRSLADSHINRNGLAAGSPAPGFRLPRLDGDELSLEDYRGRRVLLVFSAPDCGPCNSLAPRLEQAHRHRPDVDVLMVSRGDAEANRRKITEQRVTFPVVLQKHWEVSRLYESFGTPIGYLINENGIIASNVAAGPEQILALLSDAASSLSRKEV